MLNLSACPLAVNGAAIRVLDSGGGGPAIVFVHGAGGRADRWTRNLEALAAAGYRACAFDLPGHGFAAKGAQVDCSLDAYRGVLGGVLDAIGARRAAVVGTSLGGLVAGSYAVRNPDRVEALVLVGSMGLVPVDAATRERVRAGLLEQSREAIERKLRRLVVDQSLVTPALVEEDFRINNSPGASESFAALGRELVEGYDEAPLAPALARTGLPVLLLWGEQDQSLPSSTLMPSAKRVVLGKAGHAPYLDQPQAFNAALIEFLRK